MPPEAPRFICASSGEQISTNMGDFAPPISSLINKNLKSWIVVRARWAQVPWLSALLTPARSCMPDPRGDSASPLIIRRATRPSATCEAPRQPSERKASSSCHGYRHRCRRDHAASTPTNCSAGTPVTEVKITRHRDHMPSMPMRLDVLPIALPSDDTVAPIWLTPSDYKHLCLNVHSRAWLRSIWQASRCIVDAYICA